MKVVLCDYGAGNLRSVSAAFGRAGASAVVSTDPGEVLWAPLVVIAGVGHVESAARGLEPVAAALRERVAQERPTLGLCVGMQLLFEGSEEDPAEPGLALLPGVVRRLRPAARVPHTGWNTVRVRRAHPLLAGLRDGAHYYFVHSYAAEPADAEAVLATTEHGAELAAVVGAPGIVGSQFHPEKSGAVGASFLRSFVAAVS